VEQLQDNYTGRLALPVNIRLGWELLPSTNAPAYNLALSNTSRLLTGNYTGRLALPVNIRLGWKMVTAANTQAFNLALSKTSRASTGKIYV
jgi:hypothetical protein